MIFRHFARDTSNQHSFLIASCDGRGAAIVNPAIELSERYAETLRELDLHLEYTFETTSSDASRQAAEQLSRSTGSKRVAPGLAIDEGSIDARIGGCLEIGDLTVSFAAPPAGFGGDIAYRILFYTFTDQSVLIDYCERAASGEVEPETLFDHIRPHTAPAIAPRNHGPIQSFRENRRDVDIERLTLEDLHTSLAERRFTPKEERLILAYIRHLEDNDFEAPSASGLAEILRDVDRTAVHVLVHNIRWKQIDLDRMPVVLSGQTSKWLKGLQTRPEYTSHEREFLAAYLRLVGRNQEPPSGPEIAEELGGDRNVQWVRKRAHTIRRKQRAFEQPVLVLSRKSNGTHGGSRYRGTGHADFDLRQSA